MLNAHCGAVVPSGPIAKRLGPFWEDGSSLVMMTMMMTMITGVGRKVEKDEGKEHLIEEAGRVGGR